MTVQTQDLSRMRGDTYPDEFIFNSESLGGVLPLTGYSFRLVVCSEMFPIDDTSKVYELVGTIIDLKQEGLISHQQQNKQTM